MEDLDREFLAWLAGFFEGEGNFDTGFVNGKHPRALITISQTDKRPLELIQSRLGGYLKYRKYNNPSWKPLWTWGTGKRFEAIKIVRVLLPYLRFKREKIEQKIKLVENVPAKRPSISPRRFSNGEIKFIRNHWRETDECVARALGRNLQTVRCKRLKLGLKKPNSKRKHDWELIKKLYLSGLSTCQIEKRYGISSAGYALKKLGLMRNHSESNLLRYAHEQKAFTISEQGEKLEWKN